MTTALSEYSNRHSKEDGFTHLTICKCMGFQVTDKYYEHKPERVISVTGTTFMWIIPVTTDQTIPANRPDIVLHDKE
jgi:hypothetical protein